MLEILQGQFFWGIVVGLFLSLVGGWALAQCTASLTQRHQRKVVVAFCIDVVQNLRKIVSEMDSTRDRARAIHPDFLALIDAEIEVYQRNREHLILLPDKEREHFRKFINEFSTRKAQVANKLQEFGVWYSLADQAKREGRNNDAQSHHLSAAAPLEEAQKAADKLVVTANGAAELLTLLEKVKPK